jgi:pimeloyl-ACP methyl ester carboxylesterase
VTDFATSADGTRIAYDRFGDGTPVIVVSGMFCARPMTHDLATRLAEQFTVINYDRRGRGESGDTLPYAPEREVQDLAALITEVGGKAAVYGHSSGAGLAVRAAAAGLPITRLVLHEPPYGSDDETSRDSARAVADRIRTAITGGRPGDAVAIFMTNSGMPPAMAEATGRDPGMQAVAPTMPYDLAVMDSFEGGGVIPADVVRTLDIPTLVLLGGASPEFFGSAATRLTELLPDAHLTVLDGADHGAPADVVAPPVAAFFA